MFNKLFLLFLIPILSIKGFPQRIDPTDFDIHRFTKFPYNSLDLFGPLIKEIQPSHSYKYWEFIFNSNFEKRGKTIASVGDSVTYAKLASKYSSENGFFNFCHPLICFSYIVAIKDKNNVEIIDSKEEFQSFIGKINNIEEVFYLSNLLDFNFVTDTLVTGSYRKKGSKYLLYLNKNLYNNVDATFPITRKSVKAIIKKSGEFLVIEEKIYFKENDDIEEK
jgi:hypothetical protein